MWICAHHLITLHWQIASMPIIYHQLYYLLHDSFGTRQVDDNLTNASDKLTRKFLVDGSTIWDDIKSSSKFAIFTRLKIEGGVGQRHITEKLPLKIQTVEGGGGLRSDF